MLKKVLVTLIPLLAVCTGQLPELTNSQELDPNGTFRLSWEVQDVSKDIILEVRAKVLGWVSIAILNTELTLADLIVGGYDNADSLPYVYDMNCPVYGLGEYGRPVVDPSPDVVLQSAVESTSQSEIVVRWKRSLNTGDIDDIPIVPGNMTVGWSYSDMDGLTSPQTDAGFALVVFIPEE